MTGNVKTWNAIYVNSRSEKKVAQYLLEKGIEAYVPIIQEIRQWSDRKKKVSVPLINGYVFVRINQFEIDKVLQTKGVVAFVKSIGKIATIKDSEISRLKKLVELGYIPEAKGIEGKIEIGDSIVVNSGIFKGLQGFIKEIGNNKYFSIVIECIGQVVTIKVPADLLSLTGK